MTSRNEVYLAYLTGEDVELPERPQSVNEHYLAALCGEDVELPSPRTRNALYLARLAGQDVELPDAPQSLNEHYLAALCGEDVELPPPTSRISTLLATLVAQGGIKRGYTLTSSDFMYQVGAQNTYNANSPYRKQIASRATYVDFDLLLKPGGTYSFTLTTTAGNGYFGTQFYNQDVLDAVAACRDYNNSSVYDPGWHPEGTVYTYTVGQVSGKDIVGVRLTVKNNNNSTVQEGYIVSLVIEAQ